MAEAIILLINILVLSSSFTDGRDTCFGHLNAMQKLDLKRYIFGGILGFLLGIVFLHPFSMFLQGMIHPTFQLDFKSFLSAFSSHHLPMAFFFGLLGLTVSCIILFLVQALMKERERVKILEGLLPICSYCKKIRDDEGQDPGEGDWVRIEEYFSHRTNADFSHGVCPECYPKMMKEIEKCKR